MNSGFLATEMRAVGSLTERTVASTTAVFNGTGEQTTIAAGSSWAVVYFQATLLSGGSGDSALAQLVNLTDSEVYATLVLTQAGTFTIDCKGREFGPLIEPSNGSMTLTARVINATNGDEVAVLANLEQCYIDPVA